MGDFSAAGSFYSPIDDGGSTAVDVAVPPQVLARWAAMASERACAAMLPTQVRAAV